MVRFFNEYVRDTNRGFQLGPTPVGGSAFSQLTKAMREDLGVAVDIGDDYGESDFGS
jgi:hypothetical protein